MKKSFLLRAHLIELTQAERVIRKFGGVRPLLNALIECGRKRTRTTIYKWTYATEAGGTGGLIPPRALNDVLHAAKLVGIKFSQEDLDPRPQRVQLSRYERYEFDDIDRAKEQAIQDRENRRLAKEILS